MYDKQRIGEIIDNVEKYKKDLEKYNIKSKEDLNDNKTFYASSMIVFSILNRVIDLGNEIILDEHLGSPKTYDDVMPILSKGGMMNEKEAEELNELIKKRNIFAHFYGEINKEDLYKIINKLNLVDNFVRKIKKRIVIKQEEGENAV